MMQKAEGAGWVETPSGYGRIKGSCGETMEVWLLMEGEIIKEALFGTDGCEASRMCGEAVVRLATGRTVDEAAMVERDTVLEEARGLPEGESHCAALAAETLHAAIHSWMIG